MGARGRLSPTLLDRFLPDTLLVVSSPPPPMPEDSRCLVCPLPTLATATQSSTARGRRSPSTSSTTTLEPLPPPTLSTRWLPPPSVSPTLPMWASAPTLSELLSPARFFSLEMSWTRINWTFDQTPFVSTAQVFVKSWNKKHYFHKR